MWTQVKLKWNKILEETLKNVLKNDKYLKVQQLLKLKLKNKLKINGNKKTKMNKNGKSTITKLETVKI